MRAADSPNAGIYRSEVGEGMGTPHPTTLNTPYKCLKKGFQRAGPKEIFGAFTLVKSPYKYGPK